MFCGVNIFVNICIKPPKALKMLQKVHIGCLDINEKIMNNQSFEHFPLSFQHRKFERMNIKMNIFIACGRGSRFTELSRGDMMRKEGAKAWTAGHFR